MTTMAEPEFDEHTRSLMLGYDGVELCPVCGGPAYLCQDSETQEKWKALPPVRCHRQTAVLADQAKFTEQTNPQMLALFWRAALDDERA